MCFSLVAPDQVKLTRFSTPRYFHATKLGRASDPRKGFFDAVNDGVAAIDVLQRDAESHSVEIDDSAPQGLVAVLEERSSAPEIGRRVVDIGERVIRQVGVCWVTGHAQTPFQRPRLAGEQKINGDGGNRAFRLGLGWR